MKHNAPLSLSSGRLPSYKKPPVNEVVCGIRFSTPDKLRVPHIGFLWDKFRTKYPTIQHAPPIASAKGELWVDDETGMPLPRLWFINEPGDQLVQFQCDRFFFNWRRKQNEYPRYSYVIENFESTYDAIVNFFEEFKFGELEPIECELSYINHLVKDQGWETLGDLSEIFSDFTCKQTGKRFLPNPNNIAWQANYQLPEQKGTLNVSLKQGIRIDDKAPLFVFELAVKGPAESTRKSDIRKWFDLAHEWIVRGFTDLTTSKAHSLWEME